MMDLFLTLCFLLFVMSTLGTLIHESGHVLGAMFVRADNIHLSIGLGKPLTTFSLKKLHITVHRLFFLGGSVKSERYPPFRKLELFCVTVLGSINNGFFALLFYFLNEVHYNNYIQFLCIFNLWLMIVNLLPFKLKEKQSDGYTLLKMIIRNK